MAIAPPARIPANKAVGCLQPAMTPICCRGRRSGYSFCSSNMTSSIFKARIVASSLVFVSVSSTFAQSPVTPMLPDVVVTATRSPQLLNATLAHTTVINREEIERSQATDVITLLEREAGLQRTQNGGLGTVSSLFLRGAPTLDTLILLDGIPLNKQDASGAVSLEHLMLDNVERVEVVRGNVSAIYGSGAIGGVIQIFTRGASQTPSAALSVDIGPRSSRRASGSVNASVGATAIGLVVSRTETDGFSAVNTAQLPNANPDADGYQNSSVNLSLVHRLSKDHNFGLRIMRSKADSDYDNAFGAPTDIQTSTARLSQSTLFTDNTWGGWRSRISLGESTDKYASRDNGLFGSDDSFDTRVTMLNWVNTVSLDAGWLATAGLELQRQRAVAATTSAFGSPYDVGRNARSVFAGIEGRAGPGDIQVNVRHDSVGALQENTGYLGYGLPVTDHVKLIANVSTAFNAPPLGYLFAPGFGNPSLRAEKARSKEVGVQYDRAGHLVRVTFFDTRITDQLVYDTATFAFANIDRARNKGAELSYQGRIGSTDLRASLTVQDPTNALTGQTLQRRARQMASFGVSHPVGPWRFDGNLHYSGKRPDAYSDPATFARVETSLASYAVLDLAVSYQLSREWVLKGRLDNVTDKHYQTVYGYNQTPRSLYVGVTWSPVLGL